MKKLPQLILVTAVLFFCRAELVLAVAPPLPSDTNEGSLILANISNPMGTCDFGSGKIDANCVPAYIAHVIKILFGLAGFICLLMILLSGFEIALGTTVGSKEHGKNRLLWAIVGFIVCALSFYIVDLIIKALSTIP